MADTARDFTYLTASVRYSLDQLKHRKKKEATLSGSRGSALADRIDTTVENIESRLDKGEARFPNASSRARTQLIMQRRILVNLTRMMHQSIPWLVNAADPPLDLGSLYFIDEIGKSIVGREIDAIPNPDSQYAALIRPFGKLRSHLELEEDPDVRIPVIFNYPATETSTALLLPIFGHEFGHVKVAEDDLDDQVLEYVEADPTTQESLKRAADYLARKNNESVGVATEKVNRRLRSWIIEMLCDEFAVQWMGPAFTFAFSSYLLALGWSQPQEGHPPTTVRIGHQLRYLAQSGWGETNRPGNAAIRPEALSWLKEVSASTPGAQSDVDVFLINTMKLIEPKVRTIVSTELGSAAYSPEDYASVAVSIREMTDNDILPVQLDSGEAIERRAILNAAWLNTILSEDESGDSASDQVPARMVEILGRSKTQAFYSKAIEMSAVLASWKEIE